MTALVAIAAGALLGVALFAGTLLVAPRLVLRNELSSHTVRQAVRLPD